MMIGIWHMKGYNEKTYIAGVSEEFPQELGWLDAYYDSYPKEATEETSGNCEEDLLIQQ
jgi:hypothetical protein